MIVLLLCVCYAGFSVVFGVACALFGDGFCASLFFVFVLEVGYGCTFGVY